MASGAGRDEGVNPLPDKLVWTTFDREDEADGQLLQIAVPVAAEWWGSSEQSLTSRPQNWTFDLHREAGGWRITKVTPGLWCGGYVQQSYCR
jgi:hypothetical protein